MNSNIKIEEWKRRLLDIGRTNKLINYKELRVGSLTFIEPGYKEIFESIYIKNNAIEFVSKSSFDDDNIRENLKENTVVINKIQSEIKKSLDNLRLRNKKSLEEQGVNILYLAIGFLKWVDRDNKNIKSPLLLLPVKIEQGNIFESHKLKLAGDEVVLNPALQLKFESEYNISLRNPDEEDFADIDSYFSELKNKLNNDEWIINEQVELGTFSFQKISMYKDFDEIEHETGHSSVVEAIMGEDVTINSEEVVSSLDTDIDSINPNEVFQILDADSSQQEAILAARKGLSFVMQGPPGTGKSQTITNIIAECLSMGKSVLFVSEKLAALNVVYNKLKENGLDEFCLQLHSNKSSKKDVIKELADTLKLPKYNEKADYTGYLNTLYLLRRDLNDYVKELHKVIGPFGKSLYEAYGILSKYYEAEDLTFNYDNVDMLTEEKLNEINSLIERYSSLYKSAKDVEYENIIDVSQLDEDETKITLEEIIDNLKEKYSLIEDINNKFNLNIGDTLDDFYNFNEIIEAVNRCSSDNFEYLSVRGLERLPNILKSLSENYAELQECKKIIEEKYNDKIYEFDFSNLLEEFANKKTEYVKFLDENNIKQHTINNLLEIEEDKIKLFSSIIEDLNIIIKYFNDELNMNIKNGINELEKKNNLLKLIMKKPNPNKRWLNSTSFNIMENLIEDFKIKDKKIKQLQGELFSNFDKDILDIDIKEMLIRFRTSYSGSFKILKSNYHKDIRLMKGLYKGSEKLNDSIIVNTLQLGKEIQEINLAISDIKGKLKEFLDDRFMDDYTDWDSINNSIEIMKEINAELKILGEEDNEEIKKLLLSDKKIRSLIDMEEKIEYVLRSKQEIEKISKDIFYEYDVFHDNESINNKLQQLLIYREYFEGVNNELCNVTKNSQNVDYETLEEDIAKVNYLKGLKQEIKDRENAVNIIIPSKNINSENISDLLNIITITIELKSEIESKNKKIIHLNDLYKRDDFKEYISGNIESFKNVNIGLRKNISSMCKSLVVSEDELNKYDNTRLEEYFYKLKNISQKINIIKDYEKVKEASSKCGIKYINIGELLETKSLEDIINAVNKRIISLWIKYQSNKFSLIRDFSKDAFELKVKKFKDSDKEQLAIAEDRLKHMLSEKRPESNTFAVRNRDNEVFLLLNEANKKRMHLPIRKLFSSIPDLLFKLKPCFLMSPLAVSSFLDINKIKFDVVVFDEASQICPEDAIGSMLRSKQVIIAGDSEQLPPTNFFTTSVSSDEFSEEVEEQYESILDKCSSILPTVNLKWHYRSRHEDLIAFSNKSIYKNLITIPSSQKRKENIGVEFIKVEEGNYERSGARINKREADKVAELVFNHFRDFPDKSLGVVTFSESQSNAIESSIRDMRMINREFEEFFSEERKEPFFIKNIESVQGDERDVIIFSIGYGKDIYGNMSMNFGPLSRNGGYRRLNVAITRAKYNVKVVSSIEPSDIDLSRTKAEGVRMLKSYLEFSKNGFGKDDELVSHSLESTVEKEIYNLLVRNGYDVDAYVGTSEYKINLAVKDPEDDEKYILAIELDGYRYSSNSTAREKYRLREELLRSMGWEFYRIWSTEWIKDRQKTENELLSYIEKIIKERAEEKEIIIENNYIEAIIQDENTEDFAEDEYVEDTYMNNSEFEDVCIDDSEQDNSEVEYINDSELNDSKVEYVYTNDSEIDDYENSYMQDDFLDEYLEEISQNLYDKTLKEDYDIRNSTEGGDEEDSNSESCIEAISEDMSIEDKCSILENKEPENERTIEKDKKIENIVKYHDQNPNESIKPNYLETEVHENRFALENKSISQHIDKKKIIEDIVIREYPINVKYICEHIYQLDNLDKVTSSYRKDILKYISDNIDNIEIKDDEFLWIKDSKKFNLKSKAYYNGEIKYICKEEIGLAMIKLLQEKGSMSKEELFKSVSEFFGEKYDDCNANSRYLINAVDFLFEENKIRLAHGKIELKDADTYQQLEKVIDVVDYVIEEDDEKVLLKEEIQPEEERINDDKYNYIKQNIILDLYKLTTTQKLVAEYLIDNIENIEKIDSAKELGKILSTSSTTVNVTLLKLNLGSFSNLKRKIKNMK